MKKILGICTLVLCVLFFTLPLVQCSRDNSKTATGLEIATGSGDLFDKNDKGYPAAFILIIVPIILTIMAVANSSFSALRNVSIAGLLAKIIFIIYAHNLIKSDGYFELTSYNWLVVIIYIGLIGLSQYGVKQEENENYGENYPRNDNSIPEALKCRKCGKTFSSGYTACPSCGSKDFEDIVQEQNKNIYQNNPMPINYVTGATWICKKCGEENRSISSSCKGCGEYK